MKETDGILTQKRRKYAHNEKESEAKQTREKDWKNEPKKTIDVSTYSATLKLICKAVLKRKWFQIEFHTQQKHRVNSRHEKWVSSRAHEPFFVDGLLIIGAYVRSHFLRIFRIVNIHFWRMKNEMLIFWVYTKWINCHFHARSSTITTITIGRIAIAIANCMKDCKQTTNPANGKQSIPLFQWLTNSCCCLKHNFIGLYNA